MFDGPGREHDEAECGVLQFTRSLQHLGLIGVLCGMGAPRIGRWVEREFWQEVRAGASTATAADTVGVSLPTAARWFVQGGGMPTMSLSEPSGRYLSQAERDDIACWVHAGCSVREIGRRLGRPASTVSRELRRNGPPCGVHRGYRAATAQARADVRARRPTPAKLPTAGPLRE